MIQLDEEKLAKLPTTNQLLDEKYGLDGTPKREDFNAKAIAWYYGTLLRDRRRELKLTQKEVGFHSPDRTLIDITKGYTRSMLD